MPLCLCYLYIRDNRGQMRRKLRGLLRQGWVLLFILYLALLLTVTVYSRSTTNPYRSVLLHFGFRQDASWNNEIIANTLLFIPYSLLYLRAFRPARPFRDSMLATAAATCFIELAQLVFWLGEFQLSDLFHNMLGGLIGYALWRLIPIARRRLKALIRQRREKALRKRSETEGS